MKKKVIIITSATALIILIFWIAGVIPKQIGKIYGIKYMEYNFPEMQLDYIDIEWSKYHDNYIIKFVDNDNQKYSCVIGPKYFPIAISQGLFEIQNIYQDRYKGPNLIEQKIAIASFIVSATNDKSFYLEEDMTITDNLLATYMNIMNSKVIQYKLKEKYSNVGNIEIENAKGTDILYAIYACDNHTEKECVDITNTYITEFAKNIVEIYNIKNVSIIDGVSISTRLIEK